MSVNICIIVCFSSHFHNFRRLAQCALPHLKTCSFDSMDFGPEQFMIVHGISHNLANQRFCLRDKSLQSTAVSSLVAFISTFFHGLCSIPPLRALPECIRHQNLQCILKERHIYRLMQQCLESILLIMIIQLI